MDWQAVDAVIKARRTDKVLGDLTNPAPVPADFSAKVAEIIEVAGHAPFHKEAAGKHRDNGLNSAVPWRFYVLDANACQATLSQMQAWGGNFMRGKVPMMMAAAGALIQVTWLPNNEEFGNMPNLEHVMAASAATQNLLLAATARGIANYWSSGGVLRDAELFNLLGIPTAEQLVGSIFLFPSTEPPLEVFGGKHRGKNTPVGDWSRWVEVPEVPS